MESNIKVVCRFRPQDPKELENNGVNFVEFDGARTAVKCNNTKDPTAIFNYDKVFDGSSTQGDVFKYSAESIADDIMAGYNGTVLAYGQTGSGKTYTMMVESEDQKGLAPRIVENIFKVIKDSSSGIEFTFKVSFMEIYMERIKDLLNPENTNLPVHEDKTKGVYVKGLLEVFVASVEEVFLAMKQGMSSRSVASTGMNAESSRSHSIFFLKVIQTNSATGSTKTGILSLVDLAGSEKISKTGATGQTLEEAKKINKSLSALGNVINALTDGKSSHVPYRDSKLTRILQESLGGNSRTTLIINCSPSSYNEGETLSTLRFGMRAKNIKNKAKINAEKSPSELRQLLKQAEKDISSLRAKLANLQGEFVQLGQGKLVETEGWALADNVIDEVATTVVEAEPDSTTEFLERENELEDQIAAKENELTEKMAIIDNLSKELASFKSLTIRLEESNQSTETELVELKSKFEKLVFEQKENEIILESLKDAKNLLETENQILKEKVQDTTKENEKLQHTLEDEKERQKHVKMAKMMAEMNPMSMMAKEEQSMRDTIVKLNRPSNDSADELSTTNSFNAKLQELEKNLVQERERSIQLEGKLKEMESEYQELLERTIQEDEQMTYHNNADAINELKAKLEHLYNTKVEQYENERDRLLGELTEKDRDIAELKSIIAAHVQKNQDLQDSFEAIAQGSTIEADAEIEALRKSMQLQLTEFDTMKNKLMKELQSRCEKVVELEISLDETRQQYQNVLKSSNSNVLQTKMAFLEKNLEQLTNVQRQLVEQNSTLKKELLTYEKKLDFKTERVEKLEKSLSTSEMNRLEMENRHAEEVASLKAQIKKWQDNQLTAPWIESSKIAKPLRGGIAAAAEPSFEDVFNADYTSSPRALNSKRSSWYISLLRKKNMLSNQ